MSLPSDDRNAELREIFFESAQEILQAMNEEALRLEKHPENLEALRGLRRSVHTLKGDAAACGFRELSHLAHEFEDVLAGENLRQSVATVETALTAADVFGEMLEAYRAGKSVPSGKVLQQMIAKLATAGVPATAAKTSKTSKTSKSKTASTNGTTSATSKASIEAPKKRKGRTKTEPSDEADPLPSAQTEPAQEDASAAAAAKTAWTDQERVAVAQAQQGTIPVYHLRFKIDPNCAMLEAALHIVRNILAKTGEVLAFAPTDAGRLEGSRTIEAASVSKIAPTDLSRKFSVPGIVSGIQIEALPLLGAQQLGTYADENRSEAAAVGDTAAASEGAPALEKAGVDKTGKPDSQSEEGSRAITPENMLRVDAERIDNVLNLVGELIIGRSMFQQTLLEFGRRFPKDPLRTRFADAFAFQSRVLNDLQRSVMKIRMVPVEQLFRRFPRLVRDTARICEKNVELVLTGQETDLDKGILDSLAEPMAHVVRNAISHGLESPEERERAGKPSQGMLRLAAYHQGNQVVIEIADDGRGLDAEKIRAKALARGLISAEEAQRLSEPEMLKLIFTPGFSTAEQITEVSGRGVGLDVVQNVMHRLKGSVSVESTAGAGTVFRLRLPLTLAIIKAILFRVEHRLYAVPLNSVAEMTRVHQSEIHLVDGHEVTQLRKQVLTLVRLGRPPEVNKDKLFVLVVSHAGQKLGLVVDELSGQEELVIKALDTSILSSDLISGVSILGDGRVVLILNLASVAERRSQRHNEPGAAPWGMLLPQEEQRKFEESAARASAGGRQ